MFVKPKLYRKTELLTTTFILHAFIYFAFILRMKLLFNLTIFLLIAGKKQLSFDFPYEFQNQLSFI